MTCVLRHPEQTFALLSVLATFVHAILSSRLGMAFIRDSRWMLGICDPFPHPSPSNRIDPNTPLPFASLRPFSPRSFIIFPILLPVHSLIRSPYFIPHIHILTYSVFSLLRNTVSSLLVIFLSHYYRTLSNSWPSNTTLLILLYS